MPQSKITEIGIISRKEDGEFSIDLKQFALRAFEKMALITKAINVKITLERIDLKTQKQLGYLHAELLPKLSEAFVETGDLPENPSELSVKNQLKEVVGFYEENIITQRIKIKGKKVRRQKVLRHYKSFQNISIGEMINVFEMAFTVLNYTQVPYGTPNEYKAKHPDKYPEFIEEINLIYNRELNKN